MAEQSHENRFVSILQCVPEAREIGQEVSLPRKRRRLDVVCRFDAPPPAFGPLAPHFAERVVAFEHVSTPLRNHSAHAALFGQVWLALEWLERRESRARGRASWTWLTETPRAPIAVVVAERISEGALQHVPALAPTDVEGVWKTPDLERGGLLVICPAQLPDADGWTFLRWWGRDDSDDASRLNALQADSSLPRSLVVALQEALMEKRIPAKESERISVIEQLRREGRQEGERATLLAIADRLFPDEVERLRAIKNLDTLRREVDVLLTGLRKG